MNPLSRLIRIAAWAPVLLLVSPPLARAAWTTDGNPVCTAARSQVEARAVSDGMGGIIVAWADIRNGGWDVYAQRLNAAGEPLWTTNGIPACVVRGDQDPLPMISDGEGGAIVVWHDYRCGSSVYAQRIDGSGTPLWTPGGVAVTVSSAGQLDPCGISDEAGGVIVTWLDGRGGSYAQRVDATGQRLWGSDGVFVAGGSNVSMAGDGSGGVIAAYTVYGNSGSQIGVQRLDATGAIQWPGGVTVCNTGTGADQAALVSDQAGGAVIAWTDGRAGNYTHIWAQRIGPSGVSQWTPNGVSLCLANGGQDSPAIVADGAHGALVAWIDHRFAPNVNLFARRIDASGDTLWQTNGVPLSIDSGARASQRLVADGQGGAIATWQDDRLGAWDIYAQRLAGDGTLRWPSTGVVLSAAPGDQTSPAIASDGHGGALVAWNDGRVSIAEDHVYAGRVDSTGGAASNVGVPGASPARFRLIAAVPNPTHEGVRVAFELPAAAEVGADVFDLGGRRVRSLADRAFGPGIQNLVWDGRDAAGTRVRDGLYFVRVRSAGAEGRCRVVIAR